MRKRKQEATQQGNPHQLSIHQHVHSRAAIARFADRDGFVRVRRKSSDATFLAKPENPIFCAARVWSDKLESGLFKAIEDAFQSEVNDILSMGVVTNHSAITAYLSIWSIRAWLKTEPFEDTDLVGISPTHLTKPDEETLESKGAAYTRGTAIPGRLALWPLVMQRHDATMSELGAIRWGAIQVNGSAQFVCPDTPGGVLFIPVTPQIALCAGYADNEINDDSVERVNLDSWARAAEFTFGYPSTGGFE